MEEKDCESAPITSRSSCILMPKNAKNSYKLVKKISLPHYSSSTLSVNMPLSRSSSCKNYQKVTWQKSFSSESINGQMNPYQYSISGNSIPYEPQIDSASTLCCQLLKLITFIFAFTVFIFFAQGFIYFLYTMACNNVATSKNVTTTSSITARQSMRNLFGPSDERQ